MISYLILYWLFGIILFILQAYLSGAEYTLSDLIGSIVWGFSWPIFTIIFLLGWGEDIVLFNKRDKEK